MIKTTHAHLQINAASHAGITGKQNEDRFRVTSFLAGFRKKTPVVLAVLCDGIGGHRAGEVAAEMGVSMITEAIGASDINHPLKVMQHAITRASDAIFKASQTDMGRKGMGATCACAWVIGDRLYTANLGDSRIYLLRAGHMMQLTTDHTWIQEALDAGIISDTDREDHPNAHVIRRYLGSQKAPEPDFRLWYFEDEQGTDALANQGFKLEPGDVLLLCSDGLTDLVSDEEISNVIEEMPQAHVPGRLIEMSNQSGGHDNITVVLLKVPPESTMVDGTFGKRGRVIGCLTAIVIVSLLITAVILGLRLRQGSLTAVEKPWPEVTVTIPAEVPAEIFTLAHTPTSVISPTIETLEATKPSITRTPFPTHTSVP